MLCDDCKRNEATFHSVKNINGFVTEVHLCPDCQRKRGFEVHSSGFGDIFGTLSDFFGDSLLPGSVCEECGTSSDEFLSSGFLGCEHCYEKFGRLILPRVQQLQSKIQHVGKVPSEEQKDNALSEIDKLKIELSKAIEIEDYEAAGRINEQLKKLKGEN